VCYKCISQDHLIADCPQNDDNNKSTKDKKEKKKDKEGKKMTFNKKKGHGYYAEWDFVASSESDDEDDKKAQRRRHLQASPSTTSLLSLTLPYHASWPRAQRYNMMRAIVGVRVKMRSPRRRNSSSYCNRFVLS
jgi:hypothetical protein